MFEDYSRIVNIEPHNMETPTGHINLSLWIDGMGISE